MASGRGGKRPGAGRKPNPLKDIRIGALTAQKILKELEHEKEIIRLYRKCGDSRLRMAIIFKLRDAAFGRPGMIEEPKPPTNLPEGLKVIVEYIGRPEDSPAAQAK